ncbi:MAG: hypothetical protein JW751_14980 [Polyangiaceae bacterium]|nr:hypothetical protein [Polyangiaceae bacterium]
MLSSSREHLKWAVVLAGRRHIIDVDWPGFDNHVAVDGVVVERWSWPGNNLITSRSFDVHGVPCTIVRRRIGLLDHGFELRVNDSGAVVEAMDAVGMPGALHPSRSSLPLALALLVLASLIIGGIVIGVVARLG